LNVPDEYLGKQVRCPQCKNAFTAAATQSGPSTPKTRPSTSSGKPAVPPPLPPAPVESEEFNYEEEEAPRRRRRPPPEDVDEEEDYEERPRKRKKRKRRQDEDLTWIDQQFLNTPLVGLIVFSVCCGNIALIFSIIGVAMCKDPKARQNAIMVLVISIIVSVIGFIVGVTIGVMDASKGPGGRF
jgi:hypothetical protein